MFDINGPTFERLVVRFLDAILPIVQELHIHYIAEYFKMSKLPQRKATFRTYELARYATDVTFQQSNRPAGNHSESKAMFSGKHKLYGYKTEVSVLPNGIAIGLSVHHPGAVLDIDIIYKRRNFHEAQIKKRDDEKILQTFCR